MLPLMDLPRIAEDYYCLIALILIVLNVERSSETRCLLHVKTLITCCFLQCFDTFGWVSQSSSGLYITCITYPYDFCFASHHIGVLTCVITICVCSASQTLSEDQAAWVKQTTERVLKILRETPPDGELFTDTVTVCCHHFLHSIPVSLLT